MTRTTIFQQLFPPLSSNGFFRAPVKWRVESNQMPEFECRELSRAWVKTKFKAKFGRFTTKEEKKSPENQHTFVGYLLFITQIFIIQDYFTTHTDQ